MIQSLDPAGVGARNLSECLLLQLVQSENFTHTNITLIQKGLPLLAKKIFEALQSYCMFLIAKHKKRRNLFGR